MKRFECSGRMVHALMGGFVALALLFVITISSFVYYRHAYTVTEDVRAQAADFVREREGLRSRMAELEETLARTERFAAKIESTAGERKDKYNGTGPVEEDELLPAAEQGNLRTAADNLGGTAWKSPFSQTLGSGMDLKLSDMAGRADAAEEKIHSIFSLRQDKVYFWASLPSMWPARGWVTGEFGDRRGWGGHGHIHAGIDIAGPIGTPIVAPGDGIVTFSGSRNGYGQALMIDHGNGISTLYGHCSAMYVNEGQRVKRGMVIAAIGNTGSSTGPHVHYEVHVDGVPVNPMLYVMQ